MRTGREVALMADAFAARTRFIALNGGKENCCVADLACGTIYVLKKSINACNEGGGRSSLLARLAERRHLGAVASFGTRSC